MANGEFVIVNLVVTTIVLRYGAVYGRGTSAKSEGFQRMSATTQRIQPEWEHEAMGKSSATYKDAHVPTSLTKWRRPMGYRLDAVLPPQKTYFGLRRRTFLIILTMVVLALLALVTGLAAGLTARGSSYVQTYVSAYARS